MLNLKHITMKWEVFCDCYWVPPKKGNVIEVLSLILLAAALSDRDIQPCKMWLVCLFPPKCLCDISGRNADMFRHHQLDVLGVEYRVLPLLLRGWVHRQELDLRQGEGCQDIIITVTLCTVYKQCHTTTLSHCHNYTVTLSFPYIYLWTLSYQGAKSLSFSTFICQFLSLISGTRPSSENYKKVRRQKHNKPRII